MLVLHSFGQKDRDATMVRGHFNVFDTTEIVAEPETFESDLIQDESNAVQLRLIEPTSPILGNELSEFIKKHHAHPSEIINEIRAKRINIHNEIIASTIGYLNTMLPGLKEYNRSLLVSTKPVEGKKWTEIEPAAIPLEVLVPLHSTYKKNQTNAADYLNTVGEAEANDSAMVVARRYSKLKSECSSVMNILRPNNIYIQLLPDQMGRLIKLNAEISSAEASYPRLQHSINGYLRHTYDYLMAHSDLDGLLKTGYDAELQWIENQDMGKRQLPFVSFLESQIVANGFSFRDALIFLCYSSRNMPNLDVQYALDPNKALTLEVYFWKLKELQNRALSEHLAHVFPNHIFNENPMLYHYATAAYLAYEVDKAGYRNSTAIAMAFLSKAGYKMHKLVCALDFKELNTNGHRYLLELLRNQSSIGGVLAGFYGGRHGVDMMRKEQKFVNKRGIQSDEIALFPSLNDSENLKE